MRVVQSKEGSSSVNAASASSFILRPTVFNASLDRPGDRDRFDRPTVKWPPSQSDLGPFQFSQICDAVAGPASQGLPLPHFLFSPPALLKEGKDLRPGATYSTEFCKATGAGPRFQDL